MNQNTLEAIGSVLNVGVPATGVTISVLRYWDFINANAAGIGVLITFFFGMIAVGFNLYNASKSRLSDKNSERVDRLEFKVDSHYESTKTSLEEILNKLN